MTARKSFEADLFTPEVAPPSPKNGNKQLLFRQFQVFLVYVFLVKNWPILTPPLLVENSANFFLFFSIETLP